MSIFKKVDESEKMPGFINQAFFKEASSEPTDKFAELKQRALAKKAQLEMLSEEKNSELDKLKKKYAINWEEEAERANKVSVYREDRQTFGAESKSVSRLDAYAVRRTTFDTDDGLNARELDYKPFTTDAYMSAMMKGASIWNPDMEEIQDAFLSSQQQESREEMMNYRTLAIAKAQKNQAWEDEQLNSVRKVNVASVRAHPLLTNPGEYTVDSKFGMNDYEAVKEQEKARVAMAESEKNKKLGIKRPGFDHEGYNKEWEDPENHRAKTAQEIYSKRLHLRLED